MITVNINGVIVKDYTITTIKEPGTMAVAR